MGFNYYITRFSQYNKLYGSIGALLVVLLLLYLISLVLLFGFELNASLAACRRSGTRLLKKGEVKRIIRKRFRIKKRKEQ